MNGGDGVCAFGIAGPLVRVFLMRAPIRTSNLLLSMVALRSTMKACHRDRSTRDAKCALVRSLARVRFCCVFVKFFTRASFSNAAFNATSTSKCAFLECTCRLFVGLFVCLVGCLVGRSLDRRVIMRTGCCREEAEDRPR